MSQQFPWHVAWKGLTAVVALAGIGTVLIDAQLRAEYAGKIAPYLVDDEVRKHVASRAEVLMLPKLDAVRKAETERLRQNYNPKFVVDASQDVLRIAIKEILYTAASNSAEVIIARQIALANERLAATFAAETAATLAQRTADDAMRQALSTITNDAVQSARRFATQHLERLLALRTLMRALGGITEAYFFKGDIQTIIDQVKRVAPEMAKIEADIRGQVSSALAQPSIVERVDRVINQIADAVLMSHIDTFRNAFDLLLAEASRLLSAMSLGPEKDKRDSEVLYPSTAMSLHHRSMLDLDAGRLTGPPDADLQLLELPQNTFIIPQFDVLFAQAADGSFDSLPLSALQQLTYGSSSIVVRSLQQGSTFAVRTNQGRFGKFSVEAIGPPLRVKYVTFRTNSSELTR
jgi:hypothetical protein